MSDKEKKNKEKKPKDAVVEAPAVAIEFRPK
jgi:hypothetical protein